MSEIKTALASLALGLCLASCSSPPQQPEPLDVGLPFHVLLVGLGDAVLLPTSLPERVQATDMQLALDPQKVVERLETELLREAFVRVTRAPAGADPLAVARAERADLILACRLEYESPIWRRRLTSGFSSWGLFLLGGPFVTELRDWQYGADAELWGSLYDVSRMDGLQVRLGDERARIAAVEASFPGLPLNFNERRRGLTPFWKSIFVPSYLLAKQGQRLEQRLNEEIVQRLASELARTLAERGDLIGGERPGGALSCALDTIRFSAPGQGRVRLEGQLRVRSNPLFDGPAAVRLIAGERLFEGVWQAAEASPEGRQFDFEVEFLPGDQRYVRLEIEAGTRDIERRSYSFDLERELGQG